MSRAAVLRTITRTLLLSWNKNEKRDFLEKGEVEGKSMKNKYEGFLSFIISFVGFCEEKRTRNLQNERCHLRKTLVNVDQAGHKYFPLVVELHRCGGACKRTPPTERKCIAATHEMIPVQVSKISGGPTESEIIYLRNETSCKCPCTSNAGSCVPETQWWDQSQCK